MDGWLWNPNVYVDKTLLNLWTKRRFGRVPVGDGVKRKVGGQHGRSKCNSNNIWHRGPFLLWNSHHIRYKKTIFSGFNPSLEVLLGNAPIHNGVMEVYPNIEFRYLPLYSPFLTPIENYFSVFQNNLKHYLHSEEQQCTSCYRPSTRTDSSRTTWKNVAPRSWRVALHQELAVWPYIKSSVKLFHKIVLMLTVIYSGVLIRKI